MAKVQNVRIISGPTFGERLLYGAVILGAIALVIKGLIIMAMWAAGLFAVAVVMLSWPKPFFSTLFVGAGVYLFRSSPGLTVGWIVFSLAVLGWIGVRRSRA